MENIDNLVETYMEWFYNENANSYDELRFLIETILISNERERILEVLIQTKQFIDENR